MTKHTVTVRDRTLSCSPRKIVGGGMGSDTLVLDLDGEWDGYAPYIVLGKGDDAIVAKYDGPVPLPSILPRGHVPMSVVGLKPGGDRIVTSKNDYAIYVMDSGYIPDKIGKEGR